MLQNEFISLEARIRQHEGKNSDNFKAICAFIMFKDQKSKLNFVKKYRKFKSNGIKKSRLNFSLRGKLLKLVQADDPKNINFQNFGNVHSQRNLCISFIFITLLTLLLFLGVFIMGQILKVTPATCILDKELYDQVPNDPESAFAKDTTNRECFCRYRNIVANLSQYRDVCAFSYFKNVLWMIMLTISSFIVFYTNQRLRDLIKKIAIWIGFKANTTESYYYTISVFIALSLNTLLQTYVLRTSLFGFSLSDYIGRVFSALKIGDYKNNVFFGFPRNWYTSVGLQIIIASLINIFSPHVFLLKYRSLNIRKNIELARRSTWSISEMKQAILAFGTDFPFLYARVGLAIIVVMSVSSGVPILYPLNLFFLITLYKTERNFFLKYAVIPPKIGEAYITFLLRVIYVALLIHITISIFAFTDETIFPKEAQYNLTNISFFVLCRNTFLKEFINYGIQERLDNIFLHVVMFAFLVLFFIILFIYEMSIKLCKKEHLDAILSEHMEVVAEKNSFDQLKKTMSLYTITSYDIFENPRYEKLKHFLKEVKLRLSL